MIDFREGVHYEVLKPPHPNGYKYRLLQSVNYVLGHYVEWEKALIGPWVHLDGNLLFLRKDYMWNGPDVIPDYDELMFPSLIHDAGYQLIAHGALPKRPWKKRFDNAFTRLSKIQGRPFTLRVAERLAVRFFGGASGRYRPAHRM